MFYSVPKLSGMVSNNFWLVDLCRKTWSTSYSLVGNTYPGATFHPAKPTRNGPNLAENRKIDDFQKILENPEKYPEEFLNESLTKLKKLGSTLSWNIL